MTRGRKPAVAPQGRVTLQKAADLAKVTYSVAYQRVSTGKIPSAEQRDDDVWTIARKDIRLIKRREPKYPEGRKPYYVRADLERAAAWERAAGSKSVVAWLSDLGDLASGYKPGK